MKTYAAAFLLAFVISFLTTPLLRNYARMRGWLDVPRLTRKIHVVPVPRVGGLAIALAFYIPILINFGLDNDISRAWLQNPPVVFGLLIGSLFMLGLGFYDDLNPLSARAKFLVQGLVVAALMFLGLEIDKIANPLGGPPFQLGWLSYPVTMLWIVGVVNAINLIDGLDGLATGASLISVLTLFAISLIYPNPITALTCISLAGALLGFLPYNFNPASIFMGDSGSLFIGFILGTTSILGSTKSSTAVAIAIPILALGLPIMDTSLAILRRMLRKRSLFKGDKDHIHHRLLDLGFSHKQVVLTLYGVCIAFSLVAFSMVYANTRQATMILGAVALTTMVCSSMLGYLNLNGTNGGFNAATRGGIRDYLQTFAVVSDRIEASQTIDGALEPLSQLVGSGIFCGASCQIHVHTATSTRHFEWKNAPHPSIQNMPERIQELGLDGSYADARVHGNLTLYWGDHPGLSDGEKAVFRALRLTLRERILQIASEKREGPHGLQVHSGGSERSSST